MNVCFGSSRHTCKGFTGHFVQFLCCIMEITKDIHPVVQLLFSYVKQSKPINHSETLTLINIERLYFVQWLRKVQCLKQVCVLVLPFDVTWSGFFLQLPSPTEKLDCKTFQSGSLFASCVIFHWFHFSCLAFVFSAIVFFPSFTLCHAAGLLTFQV